MTYQDPGPDLYDALVLDADDLRRVQGVALEGLALGGAGWDQPPLIDVSLDRLDPATPIIALVLDPVRAVIRLRTADGDELDRVVQIPATVLWSLPTTFISTEQVNEMLEAAGVTGPTYRSMWEVYRGGEEEPG